MLQSLEKQQTMSGTPESISSSEGQRIYTRASVHFCLENADQIDYTLVTLVDKIPYFSWGGSANTRLSELIEGIQTSNFETINAICTRFDFQEEGYWYDSRDRNFTGITNALVKRLSELGYEITETRIFHYLGNSGKGRISIPVVFERII